MRGHMRHAANLTVAGEVHAQLAQPQHKVPALHPGKRKYSTRCTPLPGVKTTGFPRRPTQLRLLRVVYKSVQRHIESSNLTGSTFIAVDK